MNEEEAVNFKAHTSTFPVLSGILGDIGLMQRRSAYCILSQFCTPQLQHHHENSEWLYGKGTRRVLKFDYLVS